MNVICTPNNGLNQQNSLLNNTIAVQLYGSPKNRVAGIGNRIIPTIKKWHYQPTATAWDFLSIALGVIAADTFVRRQDAADGWTREIDLTVSLCEPDAWQPVVQHLEQTLRFLSGDHWRITISGEGEQVPQVKKPELPTEDTTCLFSGGLDSLIGSLNLFAEGRFPVLVSHAYPGDRKKQITLASRLKQSFDFKHFIENVDPRWSGENEISMRARSFLFIALGVLISSGLSGNQKTLFIPENGFISLNIPLTPRRVASLSTKTTHPFFIASLQEILDTVGLPITIKNPYGFKTKGEMMRECAERAILEELAPLSVSCGKWKRKGRQCGHCIPCTIRRAAFHAANMIDGTGYITDDPKRALAHGTHNEYDDLKAVKYALDKSRTTDIKRWVLRSAPLRFDTAIQNEYVDVFRRGLREIEALIT